MPAYQFLTSSCAIIGGVFTVIGLVEAIIHHVSSQVFKKEYECPGPGLGSAWRHRCASRSAPRSAQRWVRTGVHV